MRKELIEIREQFYNDCEIDERTLGMIVHHYISLGEQAAANLTDEKIERVYQNAIQEEKEAEAKHQVTMITPDFQKYILKACQQLYKLPGEVKYDIIKRNL